MSLLSVIDLLVSEMAATRRKSGCRYLRSRAIRSRRVMGRIHLVAGVFYARDAKQAFRRDAPICARSLHLVVATCSPVARCISSHSICSDVCGCQCMDNLGTEIPRACDWSGLGLHVSGTSDYRW